MEFKEIVGYLPWGLQGISTDENLGIEIVRGYSVYGNKNTVYLITNVDDIDLDSFKPILRPLSDLTKEIEVNGEKFVPLVRLFDIVFNIEHEEFKISNPFICLRISDSTQKLEFDTKELCFWVEEINDDGNDWNPPHNQLQLFEKLYEWHFDIHGLIEKGEAIDINQLK